MSRQGSPHSSRHGSRGRSGSSPEAAQGSLVSGWTAINMPTPSQPMPSPPVIGTPSRMMGNLELNGPDTMPVESAIRSTLNRELPTTQPTSSTFQVPSQLPARLQIAPNTGSAPLKYGLDSLTAAAAFLTATDVLPTTQTPPRTGREAFAHAHPDPASLPHPWLLPSAQYAADTAVSQPGRSIRDAIAGLDVDDDDRSEVFPHNFDYELITSLEMLQAAFNPLNPQIVVHPADLEDIDGADDVEKITNLLNALKEAATIGYNSADNIDNRKGSGTDIKALNTKWNNEWSTILDAQELPLMKGAVAVGYRVAKRAQLVKAGKLDDFFLCNRGADTVSGCTQNQYLRDAHRSGISDYFGRNKKQTKLLAGLPNWCRKDYQKESYLDESWQRQKRHFITTALDRTEKQVQKDGKLGITFEIRLRNRDQSRLVEVAMGKGKGSPGKNHPRATDLDILQHIHKEFCGPSKSIDEAKELIQWAYDRYEEKLAKYKEGKTEKEIKKLIKKTGPKYVEFQMIPEWAKIYTEAELARMLGDLVHDIGEESEDEQEEHDHHEPATPSTSISKNLASPSTRTSKRVHKDREDDIEQDEDQSPLKKQKQKKKE